MKYGDKKLRHELKYFINNHEYMYLKKRLSLSLNIDKNGINNDEYLVRSLYFDDMYNSSLLEKQSGINRREKYRIRIYNYSDKTIKLEKKSKFDSYISKDSLNITKEEFYSILKDNYDFLIDSDNKLFKDFYIKTKVKLLRPCVIIDYEREAYTLDSGNVRITFDKNLRAAINSYDIFDDKIPTKMAFNKPIMIMEVKYESFLPTYVKNLIQISSFNMRSASKYVICRNILRNFK